MPDVTQGVVLSAILAAYERRLPELRAPEGVARAWETRAGLAGTRYRLLIDGETEPLERQALGIGDNGALIVDENGAQRLISLADARVLRA